MIKLNIRTSEINEETKDVVVDFASAIIELAKLNKEHTSKNAILKSDLEKAKKERAEGKRESILAEENAILAEDVRYKNACKPCKNQLKECYDVIPGGMYEAYCEYIAKASDGKLKAKVEEFIKNIGIQAPTAKGVTTTTKFFIARLGANFASNTKLAQNKRFTTAMGEAAFNKLFMGILLDILIDNKLVELPETELAKFAKAVKTKKAA